MELQPLQNSLQSSQQVNFLIATLDKVVIKHAGTEVHEAVQYLIRGFDSLREKEDIRKRAELLRYITNMDVSMVSA
jgi:hypothetical protein